MEDIAPELLEEIRDSFTEKISTNTKISELYHAIQNGTATYIEAEEYAYEVGAALADAFGEHLSAAVLPDGRMYFNIADRVLRPLLEEDHAIIANAAAQVQTALNEKAGIHIKAQATPVDNDRIDGIVNKVSAADNFDDVAWVLDEPVKTYSQAVVDETLKANVDFQGKTGLTPKIIRKAEHKCCEWCSRLEGEYEYPDVPHDTYRRHERCRCTVDYDPGSGKIQNVHSKVWKSADEYGKIEKRKNIDPSNAKKTTARMFHTQGDPMREVYGSGEVSHPEKISAFRREISECGASLVEHEHEALGYSPAIRAGYPGTVYVSKGASYSAWCHEMQHMREDRDAGWRGMRVLMDLDERYASEQRAYDIEIAMAREAGREDIAERLLANLKEERRKIYGD